MENTEKETESKKLHILYIQHGHWACKIAKKRYASNSLIRNQFSLEDIEQAALVGLTYASKRYSGDIDNVETFRAMSYKEVQGQISNFIIEPSLATRKTILKTKVESGNDVAVENHVDSKVLGIESGAIRVQLEGIISKAASILSDKESRILKEKYVEGKSLREQVERRDSLSIHRAISWHRSGLKKLKEVILKHYTLSDIRDFMHRFDRTAS